MDEKTRTLRHYGYAARLLGERIKAKTGASYMMLPDDDMQKLALDPKTEVGQLIKQARANGALSEDDEIELMGILDAVDADVDCGSPDKPLETESQGTIYLGMYAYHLPGEDDMTVKQAADALGLSTQRIYAMLQSGKLSGVHRPDGWRVFGASVKKRAGRE